MTSPLQLQNRLNDFATQETHEAVMGQLIQMAPRKLLAFTKAMNPAFRVNWHHRVFCTHLDKFVRGEITRLMIFVQPQTGKSELVSRHLPAYILGRDPDHRILAASYGDAFASEFNIDVQKIMDQERYRMIFPEVRLPRFGSDRAWIRNTTRFDVVGRNGRYNCVGVGGSATGKTAHTLIIDDPVKAAKDVASAVYREDQWRWFKSVARTRLRRDRFGTAPRILLTMCMTGDTQVMMADGTETRLDSIKVGDAIATYEEGRLTLSTVKNWKCQGPDFIFKIKTSSGAIVKANERHPFLVYRDGELEWIRLRNLVVGDQLVKAGIGASGEEFNALLRAAKNKQPVKAIVAPKLSSSQPLSIYGITTDCIVEITEDGFEDVFDIQVDRTENFIANGLVSHNTRWHHDDLAARILAEAKANPNLPQWVVLCFPAIREDMLDPLDPRELDEPLWPSMVSRADCEELKADPRTWSGLYQQRPSPEKGIIVDREWWQYYTKLPEKFDKVIQSWDLTFDETTKGSFVVGQVWGKIGADKYLIHQYRDRIGFTDQLKAFITVTANYPKSGAKIVEKKANGAALINVLKKKISGIIPQEVDGSKENRAEAVAPQIHSKNVYLPHPSIANWVNDFIEEWAVFPSGKNDDQVDACSQALSYLDDNVVRADFTIGSITGESRWAGAK